MMKSKDFNEVTEALKAAEGLALLGVTFSVKSEQRMSVAGLGKADEVIRKVYTVYVVAWESV